MSCLCVRVRQSKHLAFGESDLAVLLQQILRVDSLSDWDVEDGGVVPFGCSGSVGEFVKESRDVGSLEGEVRRKRRRVDGVDGRSSL